MLLGVNILPCALSLVVFFSVHTLEAGVPSPSFHSWALSCSQCPSSVVFYLCLCFLFNCGLQSPSSMIPCLNVSSPAWPDCWQRSPRSTFSGGYHLFLAVCHLQRGSHGCKTSLRLGPPAWGGAGLQPVSSLKSCSGLKPLLCWGSWSCGWWTLCPVEHHLHGSGTLPAFVHFHFPSVHLFTHACCVVIYHQITPFICGSVIVTACMYSRPCENTKSVWYKHSAAISIDKEKHISCTLSFNRALNFLAVKLSLRLELEYSIGNAKRKEAEWKWLPKLETEHKVNAFQVKRKKKNKNKPAKR